MLITVDMPLVPALTLDADPAWVRAALTAPRDHVAAVIGAQRLRECREISMLHPDSLAMLAFFASRAVGPVLEIGPFVGGSTAAICAGLAQHDSPTARVVSIELGGTRSDSSALSTSDIVADLRRNLARLGCAERVTVIARHAADPRAERDVREALRTMAAASGTADLRFGMIVIDADGLVEEHLGRYAELLRDDCLVVLDDFMTPGPYVAEGYGVKEALLRRFVEEQCRVGRLRELALVAWSTWFGQIAGAEARKWLASRRASIKPDAGHGYGTALLVSTPADTHDARHRSTAVLFEDGVALGPPHALHDDIRTLGGGRFSLWMSDASPQGGPYAAHLYFSASDNSDPRTNGRRYELEVDGARIDLRRA